MMAHWLVKSEPDVYSWDRLVAEKRAVWDGVRNHQAKKNLQAMQVGDMALFYHSNVGKCVMGVCKIIKAAYPDPTAPGTPWVVVDVAPVAAFKTPVGLADIKAHSKLQNIGLVRQGRLSVMPVTAAEWATLTKLGGL
jgi:predicted RNA-binding protein with PUA-like domain